MSKAFGRLPDPVLLPWLPTLISTLRDQAGEMVPTLVREAGRTFPGSLPALDAWVPPWETPPPAAAAPPGPLAGPLANEPVTGLLLAHPGTVDAMAALLGCDGVWLAPESAPVAPPEQHAVADLLTRHPETTTAVGDLLGVGCGG
jgi:hypothetical protein